MRQKYTLSMFELEIDLECIVVIIMLWLQYNAMRYNVTYISVSVIWKQSIEDRFNLLGGLQHQGLFQIDDIVQAQLVLFVPVHRQTLDIFTHDHMRARFFRWNRGWNWQFDNRFWVQLLLLLLLLLVDSAPESAMATFSFFKNYFLKKTTSILPCLASPRLE